MRCPTGDALSAFVELDLEPSVEREVRAHLRQCPDCEAEVERSNPSWRFARLPRRTLADQPWAEMLRAVRLEVAANPRVRLRDRLAGWLNLGRLVPIGSAVVGLLLVAVIVLRPSGDVEVAIAPSGSADDPLVALLAAAPAASAVASSFVYRSNPLAQVAEISVVGDGTEPVQITMVVDETLADLF